MLEKLRFFCRRIFSTPASLALVSYLLLLLSRLIDTSLLNLDNTYLSVVVLQMMIFLFPSAFRIRYKGEGYLRRLRLPPGKPETLLLALEAAVLLSTGGLLLSILFSGVSNLPGTFTLYETFLSHSDGSFGGVLYLILAYAALPAVCEELLFRAILCAEYEKGGAALAILMSSLLFALLHFNFSGLPVYFFAGLILSLTLYASRSVIPAMIAHFLYNLFGLFGQPYVSTFYKITGSTVLFTFVLIFLLLLSAALFCGESARLFRSYAEKNLPRTVPDVSESEPRKVRYRKVLLAPDAILCYLLWLLSTVLITFF